MKKRMSSEYAQVLPMFAMLAFVLMALMGLAVDIGRMYVARAQLGRAVDAAALAGARELPNLTDADAKARAYLAGNVSSPGLVVNVDANGTLQQVGVSAKRPVNTIFMKLFGIGTVDVSNSALAGFGVTPIDAYMTLDATGSMHQGCNGAETTTGGKCPIKEARDAANSFVNVLLGAASNGSTLIGSGAFRGCYNPPRNNTKCIDSSGAGSMITNLTSNASTLSTGISQIHAIGATGQPSGGSGTNICQALKKGYDVLYGPGHHTAANTARYLVILTDGDHVYNASEVNQSSPQSPESPCRPTSPSSSDGDVSPNCRNDTQTQEGKLDTLSYNYAKTLKTTYDVEIYVVGLSICGGIINTSSTCNTSQIGDTGSSNPDSKADHNLLKCIASSTSGTNDHFFETTSAADLPGIFTQIGQQIAFRLVK